MAYERRRDNMIGSVVGGYAIIKELGTGGMGKVYLGEHRRLGYRVAIKMLLAEVARDPAICARFFNEARATSLIGHPGIVEIINCDLHEGRPYIVMELLDGESLAGVMARVGPLAGEIVTVGSVIGQVASALGAAHARGIVHRDLTPDNVFVLVAGTAPVQVTTKILDFGVAKLTGDSRGQSARTEPGTVLGTPAYMSPEQCLGASSVDHRADIYALGCIAFEMLTGRLPFTRPSIAELIQAHVREPVPLASRLRPGIPRSVDELVSRMMAKHPELRPGSMREVVTALEAVVRARAGSFPFVVPATSKLLGGGPSASAAANTTNIQPPS